MMTSVSGVRGIGKTYFLAKELYSRYQQGFLCVSNFRHLHAHVVTRTKDDFFEVIRELGRFKKMGYELCDLLPTFKHTGVFIAIDEAHLLFGADEWRRYQQDDRFSFIIEFLAQARKQDVEIWYAAQDPAKVDKNWRRYTEDWIRYTAVIPIRRKVLKPHPTRPILRAEVRYLIPWMREEHHDLDYSNPVFNYSLSRDEDGYDRMAKNNTLKSSRWLLSGWMDPFPYRLYDSHEMLAMEALEETESFPIIRNLSFIPPVMKRERFPTFKRWLHLQRNDEKIPIRYDAKDIELPSPESVVPADNILRQPRELVKDIKDFLGSRSKHDNEARANYADWISRMEHEATGT